MVDLAKSLSEEETLMRGKGHKSQKRCKPENGGRELVKNGCELVKKGANYYDI